jgi:hypothetical protein
MVFAVNNRPVAICSTPFILTSHLTMKRRRGGFVSAVCLASLELTQLDCRITAGKLRSSAGVSSAIRASPLASARIRMSSGFLDTFDPFDISRGALPENIPSIGVT